jgi:hypothetical protein
MFPDLRAEPACCQLKASHEKKQHKKLEIRLNTNLHEIKLHLMMARLIESASGKVLEQFPEGVRKSAARVQPKQGD